MQVQLRSRETYRHIVVNRDRMEHVMEELKSSSVMVAGGAGFVGSAIVRDLLKRDCQVVSYDNYLHGCPENLQGLKGPLTVVNGDLLDTWKLVRIINEHKIKYIIDCAGDTYVPTGYELPQRFFDVNLQATFDLLMAAKLCGVERMVYVSSTEVYGQTTSAEIAEDAPLNPLNTYAVSKLAADRLCFTFFIEHHIPVIIARIFNCYGPRETHPYIVPEIISQLNKGSTITLGNIKSQRDLTYITDTARALISILTSDIPNGEAVNVGSGTMHRIDSLVYLIAEIMGLGEVQIIQDPRRFRRLDIESFLCDNKKLRHYTDWMPKVDIKEGLRQTVAWFKKNGCRWSWETSTRDVLFDTKVT